MTATTYPIAEAVRVFLDFDPMPFAADGTGRLVALSPFSIEWGQSAPWDAPTPAVLSITLLDTDGKYSDHVGSLVGRRITVQPAWNNATKPTDWAVFDGFITDVSLVANETPYRISVTASDRMYVLQNDTAQQPNTGVSPAYQGKGYQWWLIGTNTVISDRLKADGIEQVFYSYRNYPIPQAASDRVKLTDMIRGKIVRGSTDDGFTLYANQPMYVHCWNNIGPTFVMQPVEWTALAILTGAQIVRADGVDINTDNQTLDAAVCHIDANAELSATDDYYTQLEVRYSHRSLTNANATEAQRQQEATYYTFNQDGARLVRVDGSARDGENVLTIDVEWCEYETTAESLVSSIDLTPTVDMLREANARVRLPNVTVYSGSGAAQELFRPAPWPVQIIGSRYESINPQTHGAWLILGGTITYDATERRGHWASELALYPLHSTAAASATPTISAMTRMDADTFAAGDWKLGALRYVTDCKPISEVTA